MHALLCVCFLLFLVLSVHTWQLLVSVYVYVCPVLCFLFFVRVCLLVDASVVCVLKMLLFLLLLFCFFMCVPISIWSCVHICGWDRVVLGGVYVWGRGRHSTSGVRVLKHSSTIPAINAFSLPTGSPLLD